MKTPQRESDRQLGHGKVVARFFVISAALGLLIGLFEASLLWTTPRVIPLLVPDVGWVIWFLAPLVDMVFFGLVGLGLGWVSSRITAKELPLAVEGGIAVTFVYLMLKWFHIEIGLHPFFFDAEVLVPLVIFAVGSAVSLLFLALIWHRLAGTWEPMARTLLKPLAWGLAAVTAVAVVGIGVFVVRPSFSATSAQAAPPPTGAPNIVFITLDTVRADHLSAYGYDRPTTPNLDRFAQTGVLFENAIAPASWTLTSHASMFTGLLPQQHGADLAVPLRPGPRTMAQILRSWGYETTGFTANFYYMERGWGIAQGFETYNDNSSCLRGNLSQTLLGDAVFQPLYQTFCRYEFFKRRDAQELNASIFRWYRHRSRRPFFLFINYLDAHDPYVTSGAYNHRFGKVPMELTRKLYFAQDREASAFSFGPRERALLVDGYDNCLAYLDDQVGKLLKFLRQSSEWKNTIVIITSDHGEEFGGHGSFNHGRNLYRGVLHVPLIIAGPGIPKGVRINHIVATRELFSTVLDFADGGKKAFSRYSLERFWERGFKSKDSDDAVISEVVPQWAGDGGPMTSLTTPQWQYIEHRSGRQELYRWTVDPEEKDNLAASPQDQATLNSLRSRLIDLVSNATGPWHGTPYLHALDKVAGSGQFRLLFPKPLQPGAAGNPSRIGIAQAYFKPQESEPTRPSQSERDRLKSLPYQ